MKKIVAACALVACLGVLAVRADARDTYLDIQQIKTKSGLDVWYVRDTTIPVISMKFSVQGGAQLDPVGQEGVAELISVLLDEGAGSRDAEAFQNEMDRYGIKIGFTSGRDRFYGTMKTTLQYKSNAVGLLSDAVNVPHFESDAVQRMQEALISGLRFNQMSPAWIANKSLFESVFEGQDYARPVEGTEATIQKISAQNLKQHKNKLFCKSGLKISIVGDVDEADVVQMVDTVFGQWPVCAKESNAEPMQLKHKGEVVRVHRDGAQSVVLMTQGAIARQHPDWWSARILDFALGSGQFSSRLMDEIRVKRSLTYGISTGIATYDRAPLWMIQSSVDPKNVDKAIDLVKTIWTDVAQNGLTDAEINAAKDYLIGSLPLALTSTGQIASVVLQLQEDGLPADTLDRREAEIRSVTADDIKRVAKELLDASALTIVVVGPEAKGKAQ